MPDGTDDLIALAKRRDTASRERLLMGLAAMCEQAATTLDRNDQVKAAIEQIFMVLVGQTERDVRRRLAERIAAADWAPRGLINVLALDEIEIAQPVIASSPLLEDTDLIRLIVEATLEHQIAVAHRRAISEPVVRAILDANASPALLALAGNESAHINAEGMERLVESSRRLPALRAPLTRHPKLTDALGARLYRWVGDALRVSLVQRFHLDEAALILEIEAAVNDLRTGPDTDSAPGAPESDEDVRVNKTLIEKLDAAGQLKSGFLLRSLREQKFGLFLAALARLAGLDITDLRRAVDSARPDLLALACIAAGVDRGAFAAVLGQVRALNGGKPDGGHEGESRAVQMFAACTQAAAAGNFRAAIAIL